MVGSLKGKIALVTGGSRGMDHRTERASGRWSGVKEASSLAEIFQARRSRSITEEVDGYERGEV